ncbi:MAG: hypothetical protein ACI8SC_003044 [Colwellia sp.]
MFTTIKVLFSLTRAKKQAINCNYANNYYGDQYCQQQSK